MRIQSHFMPKHPLLLGPMYEVMLALSTYTWNLIIALHDYVSHQQHLLLGSMYIVHEAHMHKMYDVENVHMINSWQSYIIPVGDWLSHQYRLYLGSMHKSDDMNMHKMYAMENTHMIDSCQSFRHKLWLGHALCDSFLQSFLPKNTINIHKSVLISCNYVRQDMCGNYLVL